MQMLVTMLLSLFDSLFGSLFMRRQTTALPSASLLDGLRCDYLIGTDAPGHGKPDRFTVVSYNVAQPLMQGESGAYLNTLLENFQRMSAAERKHYEPYLKQQGTAASYGEGIPDPNGQGFWHNLDEQLRRRQNQGFTIIGDVDNGDSFTPATMLRVYKIAAGYGFKIVAKNPGLGCSSIEGDSDAEEREDATLLVAHPAVIAIIVEEGAGTPSEMQAMRIAAGKPDLPVFFVAYTRKRHNGLQWAKATARAAAQFKNMTVSHSPDGEYTSAVAISA